MAPKAAILQFKHTTEIDILYAINSYLSFRDPVTGLSLTGYEVIEDPSERGKYVIVHIENFRNIRLKKPVFAGYVKIREIQERVGLVCEVEIFINKKHSARFNKIILNLPAFLCGKFNLVDPSKKIEFRKIPKYLLDPDLRMSDFSIKEPVIVGEGEDISLSDLKNPETTLVKPKMPEEPIEGSNLDDWFDYYDKCKKAGYKCTFNDIAEKSGYSPGYLRQIHPHYKSQHDDKPPKKTPNKKT